MFAIILTKTFLMSAIKVDESFFGGTRKVKRGRFAAGKAPVFVPNKSGDNVYTKIITDASGQILMPITAHKVIPFDSQPTINILKKSFFLNAKNYLD